MHLLRATCLALLLLAISLPHHAQGIEIPRTGQTTSYAEGDDGDLQTGIPWPSPRFVSHGDGTLTDNLTGLMWLADLNCPATIGLAADGKVPWADAFTFAGAVNAGADCAGYTASYTDWRVPNVNELESLVNYEPWGLAWLAGHGFVNAPSLFEYHWSSSASFSACERFYVSGMFTRGGTSTQKAVLVRGDATGPARLPKTGVTTSCHTGDDGDRELGAPWPTPRFTDNGDGTITDRLTSLMWMKDAACIRSSGGDADGYIEWAEALGFAEAVNNGGNLSACAGYAAAYSDWRLPNVRELKSLLDISRLSPGLPTGHPFVNVESSPESFAYWSSTTRGLDHIQAHVVWFGEPLVTSQSKFGSQPVWLVRDAPPVSSDCVPSDTTLCLRNGRFKVEVEWRTPQGSQGVGHAVSLTADTGYFWFFNAANVEMVLKVLNGCPVNQHYWVFAGGLTNVEARTTVTDTERGASKTYLNPIGTPFQPLQDTEGFATCP